VYGWYADLTVTNCTFTNNYTPAGAGGLTLVLDSSMTMTNCIFWGNEGGSGPFQLAAGSETEKKITYCYFQECERYCSDPDDHNICVDPFLSNPLFMRDPCDGGDGWADDPNTPENESSNNDYGDLRLSPGSPCVDIGNNDADTDARTGETDPLPATDLAGYDRIVDGDCADDPIVDIGAYEFDLGFHGDCSGDCFVNFIDFAIFADRWLDGPCNADNDWCAKADINRKGDVSLDDLLIIAQYWLTGIP
jgi:hypothetical protein